MIGDNRWQWNETVGKKMLYAGHHHVGTIGSVEIDGITTQDHITQLEEGVFEWKRIFHFIEPFPGKVNELSMDFTTAFPAEYWMIPAVSYNGNHWGQGKEPKGYEINGQPWVFAYHRTSVPGATYSEGKQFSVGLFGKMTDGAGFSCSICPEERSTIHRLLWPEQEKPYVYAARDKYESSYEEKLTFNAGDSFEAIGYIVIQDVRTPKFAWKTMLEFAWKRNSHSLQNWHSPQRIWDLGIQFVTDSLWVEDGVFRGFTWGLAWKENQWVQKREAPYEIGWVGQNASLANSLLHHYLKTNDAEALRKGISVLDCWAEYAPLPNGLFRCRFDYIIDKPREQSEAQDACNLSTAANQYFEAASLAERCGIERPQYREIALGICNFAVQAQQDNGKFAKCWNNEGEVIDPEGTIGAFLIVPLLEAHRQTGDPNYLLAAQKGYSYYIEEFYRNGFSTAGALDTYCIDKESSIPLIQGGLALYEATGEYRFLECAEDASWYAATWQWHHSVRFPEGSALNGQQYDSFGGTSVSTQHHHIDHYALTIVRDWIKLSRITNNPVWQERARAIWANATAVISDGTLSIWDKTRPPGGQDEGFCETRWHTSMGHFFGVSQWLVAWPTAFRLEILRSKEDWSLYE
jgi:hypothetical protein